MRPHFTCSHKRRAIIQWVKWPGQAGGSGDGGVEGVENLAHFEHKRTLFNMANTVLYQEAHATARGAGLKPEQRG